jgi:hypothetical protein
MDTVMITVHIDHLAAQLRKLADLADMYPGDSTIGAELADAISETAGPCAVHPNMDVRDAYVVLTARCGITVFHAAEGAFSPSQTAPSNEARTLADALHRHPDAATVTLEVPATYSWKNDGNLKSLRV